MKWKYKDNMLVTIASKNPVKTKAIQGAFEKVFQDQAFIFEGIPCSSGVSDQPIGEPETLSGALNRLKELKRLKPEANYWASIEGGLQEKEGKLSVFAWVIIHSAKIEGRAKTAMFELPEALAKYVREGKELGHADDLVFNRQNSKQGDGTVGALTNQVIDRTEYYEHAAVLALMPFINPHLY